MKVDTTEATASTTFNSSYTMTNMKVDTTEATASTTFNSTFTTTTMKFDTTEATATVTPQVSPHDEAPKVIVAKSDFYQAIQSIDSVMETERLKSKKAEETNKNTDESMIDQDKMEVDANDDEDEKFQKPSPKELFLSHVHASLKERLYQIVQPISDEEFHRQARRLVIEEQILDEDEEEEFIIAQEEKARRVQEEAQKQIHESRADGMNTDYDDHELMDQEALKRARGLRDQVRSLALQTKQQQEAVLERAIQLAQREVRLLTDDILLEQEDEVADLHQSTRDSLARRQILQQMEASLYALTNSLSNTVDSNLPKNLRDLRDTINNIQKSLQKKEEPLTLSQTEQAIIARDNEGVNHLQIVGEEDEEDEDDLFELALDSFRDGTNPEFILANFLREH